MVKESRTNVTPHSRKCSNEADMSYRSLTTALTLYKGGALTLEGAADHSGLPATKVATALQSRGISIREADREVLIDRRIT